MPKFFLRLARWFREHRLVQVFVVYLSASWIVLEVATVFIEEFGLPPWFFPAAVLLLLIGLVVIAATALAQRAAAAAPLPRPMESVAESLRTGGLPKLTWRRAIAGGVLAFALWGAAAAVVVLIREPPPEPPPVGDAPRPAVAVLPFRTVGPGLEVWREGMVDLLSTNLDEAGPLRAVDPRAVLARWRDRVGAGEDARSKEQALGVARELGAEFTVVGSVVAQGDQIRVAAELLEADGSQRIETQKDGPQDSLFAVVDDITLDLVTGALRSERPANVRVAALTTSSLPALKAYLRGERLFRQARWPEAIAEYEEAVAIDSTFAMAHWRLTAAWGWNADFEAGARAADRAARHADRLPERERLKLRADQALNDWRYSALEQFRSLTKRYPDDSYVWNGLGEAIVHVGFLDNVSQYASLEPYARAIALDSTYLEALVHPFGLLLVRGDSAEARRHLERARTIDPTGPAAIGFGIAYGLVYGAPAESAAAMAALDTANIEALSEADLALTGVEPDDVQLPLRRALDQRAPSAFRNIWGWRSWFKNHGQLRESSQALEQAAALDPTAPVDEFRVLERLRGYADSTGAARAASRLANDPDPLARWLLGALALRQGRDRDAERQIAALRDYGDSARMGGDTMGAETALGYAQGLEAFMLASRGETSRAVEYLQEATHRMARFGPYGIQLDVTLYNRFVLAELLEAAGRDGEALEILTIFARDPWHHSVHAQGVPASLAAARIHERRGDRDEAVDSYAYAVRMWEDADPALQPRVEVARQALRRLTGESDADGL